MDIPVLIQQIPGRGFVATAPAFGWSAEGVTVEEAVANLKATAMKCIASGCKLTSISVPVMGDPLALAKAKGMVIEPPEGSHPLLKWAGTWNPNDPLEQEFEKAVQEHRRQMDNDPSIL